MFINHDFFKFILENLVLAFSLLLQGWMNIAPIEIEIKQNIEKEVVAPVAKTNASLSTIADRSILDYYVTSHSLEERTIEWDDDDEETEESDIWDDDDNDDDEMQESSAWDNDEDEEIEKSNDWNDDDE